jgi:hypothetical protein
MDVPLQVRRRGVRPRRQPDEREHDELRLLEARIP